MEGDFDEVLRREPPSNPFLRAHWADRGLLEAEDRGEGPGTAPVGPQAPAPPAGRAEGGR